MSSTVENFDGLCGIIPTFATSDLQIRCHYELGHGGPCSFEKHHNNFYCQAGSSLNEFEKWLLNQTNEDGIKRGFINSVLSHKK